MRIVLSTVLCTVFGCFAVADLAPCQVSDWSDWSKCFGNCTQGRQVRNRDVTVPPMPGNSFEKQCPPLYEIRRCLPPYCAENASMPTPGPLEKDPAKLHSTPSRRSDGSTLDQGHISSGNKKSMKTQDASARQGTVVLEKLLQGGDHIGFTSTEKTKDHPSEVRSTRSSLLASTEVPTEIDNSAGVTFDLSDNEVSEDSTDSVSTESDDKDQMTSQKEIMTSSKKEGSVSVEKEDVRDRVELSSSLMLNSSPDNHVMPNRNKKTSLDSHVKPDNNKSASHDIHVTPEEGLRVIDNEPKSIESVSIEPHLKRVEVAMKNQRSETGEQNKTTEEPNYFINSLTIDLPMKAEISSDVEKKLKKHLKINKIKYRDLGKTPIDSRNISSMNALLRKLESERNLPLDDTKIRKVLKKNKKLMNAILEAYRYRKEQLRKKQKSTSLESETATADDSSTEVDQKSTERNATSSEPSNEEINDDDEISTLMNETTEAPATTTSPPYWPRNGYVPNSRQHANEITSKLYLTHEIVQALSPVPQRHAPSPEECTENSRCCKVERDACPDGSEPKSVTRYYRPKGSPVCLPYHYPQCTQMEEMSEKPIQFIQNCQDLCFDEPDKVIDPLSAIPFEE